MLGRDDKEIKQKKIALEKEKQHLIDLHENIKKEKDILEEEQVILDHELADLKKEHVLLDKEVETLKQALKDREAASYSERLKLINFPETDIPDEYIDNVISYEIMTKPVQLDDMPGAILDESSLAYLKKTVDGKYINPIAPGYEIYANDTAKTGEIKTKVSGEVKKITPLVELAAKIKEFIATEEKKYYIREEERVTQRQHEIVVQAKNIQIRKEQLNEKIREIEDSLEISRKNMEEKVVEINRQLEQIETEEQIQSFQVQADNLAMTIVELEQSNNDPVLQKKITALEADIKELTRVLKEDQMEQDQIDNVLKEQNEQLAQLKEQQSQSDIGLDSLKEELRNLREIIRVLKGDDVQELKDETSSNELSMSGLTASQFNKSNLGGSLLAMSALSFSRAGFGMFASFKASTTANNVASVNPVNNAPGLKNRPNTEDID